MPAPRTIVAAVLLSTSAVAAAAPAAPKAPPPDHEVAKELLALRDEVAKKSETEVRAGLPRFSALCDADGYPLVGNVETKASRMQPSKVCTIARDARAKSVTVDADGYPVVGNVATKSGGKRT